jgi:hypothetical protein
MDAIKAEEDEKKRNEAEKQQQAKQTTFDTRVKKLESNISAEPEKNSGQKICEIMIRMPDASRLPRRFLATDKVSQLRDFVELTGLKLINSEFPEKFTIASTFPKKIFTDFSITFESAGLCPSAVVNVTYD